jgi:carbon monoxide dehydrogenase subunit G
VRIEEQSDIGVQPQRVWRVVSDPARLGRLDAGVIVEPDPANDGPGLRARYRAMLRIGPVPVGGDIEIVEFVPRRELAWTSLTGVDQRFRLRLRPLEGGRTHVILRFSYSSPGPLGLVSDLVGYNRVRQLMHHLLQAIKTEAERPPRRRKSG